MVPNVACNVRKPLGMLAVCGGAISVLIVIQGCAGRSQGPSSAATGDVAGGETSAAVKHDATQGVNAGSAGAASGSFTPVSVQATPSQATAQSSAVAIPEIGQSGGALGTADAAKLAAGNTGAKTETAEAKSPASGDSAASAVSSTSTGSAGGGANSSAASASAGVGTTTGAAVTSSASGAPGGLDALAGAGSTSATSASHGSNGSGTSSGSTLAAEVNTISPLEQLVTMMCGEFNSAEQSARDPDYRDISLKIARIWPQSTDGAWLYVEQAVATMADRPYRQRVYHVTQVPGSKALTFRSEVYTLPGDPKAFVGAWKEPTRFAAMTPAMLVERQGCAVILTQTGPGVFAGSTVERNCQSEFQKASYATSEVVIDQRGMVSWDRGFDHEGKQVWGATNGGYHFVRVGAAKSVGPTVPEK